MKEISEKFGYWLVGWHRKFEINVNEKINQSKMNVNYTKLRCSYYFSNDVASGSEKYSNFDFTVTMEQSLEEYTKNNIDNQLKLINAQIKSYEERSDNLTDAEKEDLRKLKEDKATLEAAKKNN